MYFKILLPSILALYALYKNKITLSGIILAWVLGLVITCYGDIYSFVALAFTFILTIVSDRVKKTKKDKTRNIYQITSNVLTATLGIILYALTTNEIFYVMYYAVMGASLADTLASSIGTLSKKKPFNIFTFEKIEKGASGGVTLLGLGASLIGGVLIGIIYLFASFNVTNFIVISVLGLIGSLADSVLGVMLQSQYRCIVCKKVVEDKNHCKQNTKLISGYYFIDNNVVNLLSNIIIFVLCYFLLR